MPDTDTHRLPSKHIAGAFVFQIAALAIAGWVNRHALNPDGVAYLRIASYYAEGKIESAVSGYWGPLISWLLAPWLKLGFSPLVAARIVMGLSAVFFLSGCLRIFRAFGISRSLLSWGIWTSAIVSVPWSVENITPDLLLAGLVCFAFAPMVSANWPGKSFGSFASGLWWGAAYLAKAIALPMALLTSIGIAISWKRKQLAGTGVILRNVVLTLVALTLIAAPWIRVISAKSGAFTISKSAQLNHVLVGPTVDQPRYVLDQGFQRPDPGRITIWEEPPMPYPDWSPFANVRNAWVQLRVIAANTPIVLTMLTSLNLAFPILAIYAVWSWGRRKNSSDEFPPKAWAAVPIAALSVLFLPNYLLITEQRYFYPAFPLFFVLGVGMLFPKKPSRPIPRWIQRYGAALLSIALLLPTAGRLWFRPGATHQAGDCAYELSKKIRAAGLSAPVAGSGRLPGGRAGLYLAYLLEQPWYGDDPTAGAIEYRRSGASLIVVRRGSRAAREMETDPWFHNLDPRLFDSTAKSGDFPLQVFRNLTAAGSSAP